jgi:hypothetical protein
VWVLGGTIAWKVAEEKAARQRAIDADKHRRAREKKKIEQSQDERDNIETAFDAERDVVQVGLDVQIVSGTI